MIAHKQTTQYAQIFGVKECSLILDVDFRCSLKANYQYLNVDASATNQLQYEIMM